MKTKVLKKGISLLLTLVMLLSTFLIFPINSAAESVPYIEQAQTAANITKKACDFLGVSNWGTFGSKTVEYVGYFKQGLEISNTVLSFLGFGQKDSAEQTIEEKIYEELQNLRSDVGLIGKKVDQMIAKMDEMAADEIIIARKDASLSYKILWNDFNDGYPKDMHQYVETYNEFFKDTLRTWCLDPTVRSGVQAGYYDNSSITVCHDENGELIFNPNLSNTLYPETVKASVTLEEGCLPKMTAWNIDTYQNDLRDLISKNIRAALEQNAEGLITVNNWYEFTPEGWSSFASEEEREAYLDTFCDEFIETLLYRIGLVAIEVEKDVSNFVGNFAMFCDRLTAKDSGVQALIRSLKNSYCFEGEIKDAVRSAVASYMIQTSDYAMKALDFAAKNSKIEGRKQEEIIKIWCETEEKLDGILNSELTGYDNFCYVVGGPASEGALVDLMPIFVNGYVGIECYTTGWPSTSEYTGYNEKSFTIEKSDTLTAYDYDVYDTRIDTKYGLALYALYLQTADNGKENVVGFAERIENYGGIYSRGKIDFSAKRLLLNWDPETTDLKDTDDVPLYGHRYAKKIEDECFVHYNSTEADWGHKQYAKKIVGDVLSCKTNTLERNSVISALAIFGEGYYFDGCAGATGGFEQSYDSRAHHLQDYTDMYTIVVYPLTKVTKKEEVTVRTLQELKDALKDKPSKITVAADINGECSTLVFDKTFGDVEIDLDGHTLKEVFFDSYRCSITIKNGTLVGNGYGYHVIDTKNCDLTLDGVTIRDAYYAVRTDNAETVTVKNSTITANKYAMICGGGRLVILDSHIDDNERGLALSNVQTVFDRSTFNFNAVPLDLVPFEAPSEAPSLMKASAEPSKKDPSVSVISNCTFEGNRGTSSYFERKSAITLHGGGQVVMKDCSFINSLNLVDNLIEVSDGTDLRLDGCEITGNTFYSTEGYLFTVSKAYALKIGNGAAVILAGKTNISNNEDHDLYIATQEDDLPCVTIDESFDPVEIIKVTSQAINDGQAKYAFAKTTSYGWERRFDSDTNHIHEDGNTLYIIKGNYKAINNLTPEEDNEKNHGYIVVSGESAEPGDTVTVDVYPEEHYYLRMVKYNDGTEDHFVAQGSSHCSFIMPDCADGIVVSAVFENYLVENKAPESDKEKNHGYIRINLDRAAPGEKISISVFPDSGYCLSSLKYNDGVKDYDILSEKEFSMPMHDVVVTAAFDRYTVTNGTPESDKSKNGGYIKVDKTEAVQGETVTVTAYPNSGCTLGSLKYSTGSKDVRLKATDNVCKFEMPYSDVTITAYFESEGSHSHTVGDEYLSFEPWTSTKSLPTESGHYYLTDDVTLSAEWKVPKNVTLCLNGHVIRQSKDYICCIRIPSGCTLNLCDCNGDDCTHEGYIDQSGLWHPGTGKGTPESITGGVITGASAGDGYGYSAVKVSGTFNMYSGTIAGNNSEEGAGVFISGGKFNMYGGSIVRNLAEFDDYDGIEGRGGGVFIDGTFNMYDGVIADNVTAGPGGGVLINNWKTFNMYGGTISGNTAKTLGGGVFNNIGTFNMSGGLISDNTAVRGSGGVYAGTCVLGGSAVIRNNTVNGEKNNLLVYSSNLIDLGTGENGVDAPAKDMMIGVTLQSGAGVFTNACADYSANFTADDPALGIVYADGAIAIAKHTHIVDGGEMVFIPWTSDNSLPRASGNYYLTTDVTLNGVWSIPMDTSEINLCLNGHMIRQAAAGERCISVGSRSTLSIYDCNGDNCTHEGYVDSDGLWHPGTGEGTPASITGGVITGSTDSGVYIYPAGHFNMYGGTIAGNRTDEYGGAVYSYGEFNMFDGTIGNNTAAKYGGGIEIGNGSGAFNMYGGTISNNKAEYGGGVCVYSGTLNMSNGTVSNNTASYGGGVYARSGNIILGGSSVIDNNTDNNLYIKNGFLIDFGMGDNAPTEDMKIGVTLGSGTGAFTNECADYSAYFTSDNSAYRVAYNGTGKYLELKSADSVADHTTHKAVLQKGTAPKLFTAGCKDYYKCSCGKYYEDEARTVEIKDLDSWKAKGGNGYVAPTIGEKCDECGVWHTNGLLGDIFCWMVKLIKLVVDFVHNIFKITI